jgi:2-keto-4-pentenoate hydratase
MNTMKNEKHEDSLTPNEREGFAHWILGKRENGSTVEDSAQLPPLATLSDVYDVHHHTTTIMSTLGTHCGWKCGACAPDPQQAFNIKEPFRAPLFADIVKHSGGSFPIHGVIMMEAEVAFVIGKALPPKAAGEE